MRQALHILTKPEDDLAEVVIDAQRRLPDHGVEVVDLTVPEPDYRDLLEKIFRADSVQVW
jgi:hypothetical protein